MVLNSKGKLSVTNFEIVDFIGQGGYGKVFKVIEKTSKEVLAMKVMNKKIVLKKNDSEYIRQERNILSEITHPFIVSLKFAFQTDTKLYLVMSLAEGGELFQYLECEGLFLEKDVCFYLSEMILAVDYLHSKKIVHRDLKPENVLLDKDGHIKLTDFGLATTSNRTSTICGTELYMAPEMLKGKGYGKSVDWYSLGALTYEMMIGDPPFNEDNTKKLYNMIMSSTPKFPKYLRKSSINLVKGMMNRDYTIRLGSKPSTMFKIGGVDELKSHLFFIDNSINFIDIEKKQIKPPFTKDNLLKNKKETPKEIKKRQNIVKQEQVVSRKTDEFKHKAFTGYSFVNKTFMEALVGTDNSTNASDQSHELITLPQEEEENDEFIHPEDLILQRMNSFRLTEDE